MSRIRFGILIWVVVGLHLCSVGVATEATWTPTTAPASMPTTAAADAHSAELLAEAVAEALDGNFRRAAERAELAAETTPTDAAVRAASDLLHQYERRIDRAESERLSEFEEAVSRVRWCMIAQESLESLRERGIEAPLRQKVEQVVTACGKVADSQALRDAADEEARKLKADAAEALNESHEPLSEAVKLLEADDSEYARTFRDLAGVLRERVDAYSQVWASVATTDAESREAGAERLKALEDDLAEAVTDLDAMISRKPWKAALMRATLARELATEKESLEAEPWYVQLLTEIERRGAEAIEQAEWYDALSAYAGLKDLSPDDESYQQKVRLVERHVRVLGLYGKEQVEPEAADSPDGQAPAGAEPQSQPASTVGEAEGPRWRKVVSGVDAEMVDRAIRRLSASYVAPVDFRRLTSAALLSIKVLAQTPQAAVTFEGLADERARQRFLGIIDRQLEGIEKSDRVDDLDLRLALNVVLRASERTVKIPTEVLAVEFAEGFLDELDKFSAIIWPNSVSDFRKHMLGQFVGVGIRINKVPGEPLKVVTPLAGSPAYKAGVRTGDTILAVDGEETKDHEIDELVDRIMGEKGTKVVLTIKRRGRIKPIDIAIVRDTISIRTVRGWRRQPVTGQWQYLLDADESIGYIRITQFTDETPSEVAQVLGSLRDRGAKAVILDLRLNPGGLLRSAVSVADEFLSGGRIVSTEGRQVSSSVKNAASDGRFLSGDVVVLVDKHSASAAEIVCGALKELGRAIVVGTRTYGKGSVQNVITLRHDPVSRAPIASLKLTTAHYYVGNSKQPLHHANGAKVWGVDPDVEVAMTPRQNLRWREIQFSNELLQDVKREKLDDDMARQYDEDIQLQTAVVLLKLLRLQQDHPVVARAAEADVEAVPVAVP